MKNCFSIQTLLCLIAFFLCFATVEAACVKPTLPGEAVNILLYGAIKDDGIDDTAAIQDAIDVTPNGGTLYIPAGRFMIQPDDYLGHYGIRPHSNMTIWMDDSAILEALKTTSDLSTSVISLLSVSDVVIAGGTVIGERYEHALETGENGHGIVISSSKNIEVQNLTVKEACGDGIYITEWRAVGDDPRAPDKLTEGVKICNVTAHDNRRQGLSITAADNVLIENSKFTGSNGTVPESGIDLEPNPPYTTYWVTNVMIRDCEMTDNHGHGLQVYQANHGTNTVEHSVIQRSGLDGIRVKESTGVRILRNLIEDNAKRAGNNGWYADIQLVNASNTLIQQNSLRDSTGTYPNQYGVQLIGTSNGVKIYDNDICMNQPSFRIVDATTDHAFTESLNTDSCEGDGGVGDSNNMSFLYLLLRL